MAAMTLDTNMSKSACRLCHLSDELSHVSLDLFNKTEVQEMALDADIDGLDFQSGMETIVLFKCQCRTSRISAGSFSRNFTSVFMQW